MRKTKDPQSEMIFFRNAENFLGNTFSSFDCLTLEVEKRLHN